MNNSWFPYADHLALLLAEKRRKETEERESVATADSVEPTSPSKERPA